MLAIVIPYYKYSFFEKTLKSLADQTDKRFKVYIGNDASTENPEILLRKYSKQFDFYYQKFETNLGHFSLVKQWERCLEMVGDEEWIVILGDDDMLAPNFVESFYINIEEVENQNINVIRYASVKINEIDERLSIVFKHPIIENSIKFLMRRIKGLTRSSLSEFVFRKETLMKISFKDFPLAWHSDVLAILEFSYFGMIYSINKSIVYVRSSGENISSMKDNLLQKNIATFQYYYYLLNKKYSYFKVTECEVLYFMLEKTLLDNKKEVKFWGQIIVLYLKRLKLRMLSFLFFKAFNSILKKTYNK